MNGNRSHTSYWPQMHGVPTSGPGAWNAGGGGGGVVQGSGAGTFHTRRQSVAEPEPEPEAAEVAFLPGTAERGGRGRRGGGGIEIVA